MARVSYAEQQQAVKEITTDFTFLIVTVLALLGIITLLLWPLGHLPLAFTLAKGFGLYYLAVWVFFVVLLVIHRLFRIDDDSHFDVYLLTNLAAGALPMVGWTAFAALVVRDAAAGEPVWRAAILWFIGLFTCHMAYGVVATYYSGSFYKEINLPLAGLAFLLFAVWPVAARFLFGWFFNLW
ncbi:MAG TPA: hypothetical protein VHG28_03150 [Longimicrobiaceae bacterium]|nr:hypothetical protein [Longimicrobiaceae bacterium]